MVIRKFLPLLLMGLFFTPSLSACGDGDDDIGGQASVSEDAPSALVGKKVAVLGDSYSTFEGWMPEGYALWYSTGGRNGVSSVGQTWWKQVVDECGCKLLVNSSYSGSTVCTTGYNGKEVTATAFITRMKRDIPKDVEVIFVFGGTNDSWAMSPLGEMVYSDWTAEDLKCFRPAVCYMFDYLKREFPAARVVCLVNSIISAEVANCLVDASAHYGVDCVRLKDIDFQAGHPTAEGMSTIKRQVFAYFNALAESE